MRIVSIDKQVRVGDYSFWDIKFSHDGHELTRRFGYGGALSTIDYVNGNDKELSTIIARNILAARRDLEYAITGEIDKAKAVRPPENTKDMVEAILKAIK